MKNQTLSVNNQTKESDERIRQKESDTLFNNQTKVDNNQRIVEVDTQKNQTIFVNFQMKVPKNQTKQSDKKNQTLCVNNQTKELSDLFSNGYKRAE